METKDTIHNGATIWARQTIESDIFRNKPDKWFKIWFFIVSSVNHSKRNGFDRGTGFFQYKQIMYETGATQPQVDQFVRFAKRTTMITTRKTTRGLILNILNYDKYQNLDNYKNDTKNDEAHEMETIQKRNINDTIHKNERIKELKNENIGEGISAIASPTPKEISERFFEEGSDLQKTSIDFLSERGMERSEAEREIAKFVNHWTEASPSGKKLKWQMEKTFEIKKRLNTWIGNYDKWNKQKAQSNKTFRERDDEIADQKAREAMGI
jgi:hypothetical protein